MWLFRIICVVGLVVATTGCGFKPIYGGKSGGALTSDLSSINIAPIKNRTGQLLRNALEQKINPLGTNQKKLYTLSVMISESKQELAVKKSEIATRANLLLTANYSLFSLKKRATVTSGTSQVVVGYNILAQDFATLMAEKDARQRAIKELSTDITNRLAAYFQLEQSKAASVR